jgi:hypothetical protein
MIYLVYCVLFEINFSFPSYYFIMSRKARKEASMNYMAVSAAGLGLVIIIIAGLLPYWLKFPMDALITGYPPRNFGLLKLSGKYTNVMMAGADLTWIEVRDSVCATSALFSGTGMGSPISGGAMGMGAAVGGAMVSMGNCGVTCKNHLMQRCQTYYKFTTIGFAVFGMLVGGSLLSLVGATMPLIGKERKRDRGTWLGLDFLGFALAGGACALYYFIFTTSLAEFRLTSWYPKEGLNWCFFLAAVGAVALLVPVFVQLTKILTAKDTKKGDDNAQLLTAGGSPEFMMPSAI